jgi:hypothetical protein
MRKIGLLGILFMPTFINTPVLSPKEIDDSIKTIGHEQQSLYGEHKDGRANRRERRKQQRKK